MEYGILTLTFCLSVTVCAQSSGELNDKCRTIDECRNFGYYCAANRTCQCFYPYYVPNKDWNKCVGIVDQKCLYDEHCVEGAFCEGQSKCKCKNYFHPTEGGICSDSSTIDAPGYFILPLLVLNCLRIHL